ncbi:hypothetical protein [Piscinibacter sp. XHJ-5]|uniref:hypothetical protein n=1 Tax=Piscinibacter sp. XHJ-5 TaxID=3037797 RepID=UPI002453629F|nr:hypothetical protein [Piscinibacter sp. XHJ-5]
MNNKRALALILACLPVLSLAQDALTVSDNNSAVKVTRDPAIYFGYGPSDPLRLPRKIEWTVDGRTILVYPSGPWGFIDIEHFHGGAHVAAHQLHAQGPMLGYATTTTEGTVTGGAIYTVEGGAAGSGTSRLVEKVDIHNKTGANLAVSLTGMGFKPTQASLPVPDYSGLDVTGTTVVFFQGNETKYSIADMSPPGFPPLTVRPVVSFSGFNPLLNQSFTIPPGAVLTMITELNVKRHILSLCELYPGICDRPIIVR